MIFLKINTITCHDVYNHGASLQAYALMSYLQKMGHEVEIIDYKPDYLSNHYKLFTINNPKWEKNFLTKLIYITLKIPGRLDSLKRKKSFDNFTKQYLNITSKTYHTNEELKSDLPKGDAFICGSDQIWNSLHKNGRDRAFYLDFVPKNKLKIAYAASFATDTIADEFKPMVKQLVSQLDGIGVREISGVKILNDLGINKAINVLDPVFLLSTEDWDKIAIELFEEKYLLIYDFDKNPLIKKIAQEVSKEKGYKIYSINNYKSGYEDKVFQYSGPEMFVSLVKNAKLVISNSFHAVVFSLIYNKEIVVVNRNENINTRMRDLLKLVNLENQLITEDNYNLQNALLPINYKSVNQCLEKNIRISKEYIDTVLNIVKE